MASEPATCSTKPTRHLSVLFSTKRLRSGCRTACGSAVRRTCSWRLERRGGLTNEHQDQQDGKIMQPQPPLLDAMRLCIPQDNKRTLGSGVLQIAHCRQATARFAKYVSETVVGMKLSAARPSCCLTYIVLEDLTVRVLDTPEARM